MSEVLKHLKHNEALTPIHIASHFSAELHRICIILKCKKTFKATSFTRNASVFQQYA